MRSSLLQEAVCSEDWGMRTSQAEHTADTKLPWQEAARTLPGTERMTVVSACPRDHMGKHLVP